MWIAQARQKHAMQGHGTALTWGDPKQSMWQGSWRSSPCSGAAERAGAGMLQEHPSDAGATKFPKFPIERRRMQQAANLLLRLLLLRRQRLLLGLRRRVLQHSCRWASSRQGGRQQVRSVPLQQVPW